MTNKLPLIVNCPQKLDGTSFYRAWGPFSDLMAKGFQFKTTSDLNWPELYTSCGVFLQRPYREIDLKIALMAKEHGKAVWLDYDDDLFHVPTTNLAWQMYTSEKTHKTIEELVGLADVITFSTEQLWATFMARLGTLNAQATTEVVPNAYDATRFKVPSEVSHHKTILWRGSSSHIGDLCIYRDAMAKVARAREDWSWTFIGYYPWMLDGVMPFSVETSLDVIGFMNFLQKFKPGIVVVPLDLNEFNRSKSNIAWIEATLAGALTLAPNLPEWRRPGVTLYESKEDFSEKLSEMLDYSPDKRAELFAQSLDAIPTLSSSNVLRARLLTGLSSLS